MAEKEQIDKRRNRRAFFTFDDNIDVTVVNMDNGKEPFPATLLSISVGGVSITTGRNRLNRVKAGDHLIIKDIRTPNPLGPIDQVETQILYILDDDHSVRIAMGCEFQNIPDATKDKIDDFVDERLKEMGLAY